MAIRCVKIDEHQLLVCIKNKVWGLKGKPKWDEDDLLYFIVDNKFAAVAKLISNVPYTGTSIWSDPYYELYLDIEFIKVIDNKDRSIDIREFFYEEHEIQKFGFYLFAQTPITEPTIIDSLASHFQKSKNSLDEITESIENRLIKSFLKRIINILLEFLSQSKKSRYTKNDEVFNNINTILFTELMMRDREKSFFIENSTIETYNTLLSKSQMIKKDFESLIKQICFNFAMRGNKYQLFGDSLMNLDLPLDRQFKIFKIVRRLLNEIQYGIDNKYLESDFLKTISDSHNFLNEAIYGSDQNHNEINKIPSLVLLMNSLSNEKKRQQNILKVNDVHTFIPFESEIVKQDDVQFEIFLKYDSLNERRKMILEQYMNKIIFERIHVYEENKKVEYDIIIYRSITDDLTIIKKDLTEIHQTFGEQTIFFNFINDTEFFNENREQYHDLLMNYLPAYIVVKNENSGNDQDELIISSKSLKIKEDKVPTIYIDFKDKDGVSSFIEEIKEYGLLVESKDEFVGSLFKEIINRKPTTLFEDTNVNPDPELDRNVENTNDKRLVDLENQIINHSISNSLSESQVAIIYTAFKSEDKKLSPDKFYNEYHRYIKENKKNEILSVHEFDQTLNMMEKLGIFYTESSIDKLNNNLALSNLIALKLWILNEEVKE